MKSLLNNDAHLPTKSSTQDFEALYVAVRQKEQRIYSDKQLRQLPDIEASHVHYREWKIRKRSCEKLTAYLSRKNRPLKILEIGCGNGWLAAKLALLKDTQVTGLDINRVEIEQAESVFNMENLRFVNAVFEPEHFRGNAFDVILFAASLQYFSSAKEILQKAMECLNDEGEIHIMDTHFYEPASVNDAAKRTKDYFTELGYPQLAAYYFHHTLKEIKEFSYTVLFDPNNLLNSLLKMSPFYWICIRKS
ncbi:class I SAM-dependent methyltransferase [Runella sp.]|uniref:class I SAM-dependent methyltransferase n=1 Tax=Runella sp. TaxID=1960881 RepID=UPI003D1451AC